MPDEESVPPDVQAALAGSGPAEQMFGRLPASHRREYLRWVLEAKKPETRARRVQGMIERLARATPRGGLP